MPNRGGTGPAGCGSGRGGRGMCRGSQGGRRQRCRDGSCQCLMGAESRPEWLRSRKAHLEARLAEINSELESE